MKHTCCQGAHRDAHAISGKKKLPRGYDADFFTLRRRLAGMK